MEILDGEIEVAHREVHRVIINSNIHKIIIRTPPNPPSRYINKIHKNSYRSTIIEGYLECKLQGTRVITLGSCHPSSSSIFRRNIHNPKM